MNRMLRAFCWVAAIGAVTFLSTQVLSQQSGGGQEPGKTTTRSQDQPGGMPGMDPDMMKSMMEMGAPGPFHKHLDQLIGKWSSTGKIWMAGPSAPPMETTGTSEFRWIMGGRFIQEEAKGFGMGMNYEGFSVWGYDNLRKKYTTFYVDNMGTAMYTSTGSCDPSGKVFTFYGEMDDCMTGEQGNLVKYTTRIINKDKVVFEMFTLNHATETKTGEFTYTRG